MYDDVVKRRKKHVYDDECCIAPGELDDDDDGQEEIKVIVRKTETATTKKYDGNGSSSKQTKVHSQDTPSSTKLIKDKHDAGSVDDDDARHSVQDDKSKTKSTASSIVTLKWNS